jgi:hypothetical protein
MIEPLEAKALAWAQSLKINHVCMLTLNLDVRDGKPIRHFYARIGECGIEKSYFGCGASLEAAIADAEKEWRADGAPTSPVTKDEQQIKRLAERLGYRLVKPDVDMVALAHQLCGIEEKTV